MIIITIKHFYSALLIPASVFLVHLKHAQTMASTSSSTTSLRNCAVVVTGATRGIGRGLAIGFGERGAHVIITGRTEQGALSLSATAREVGAAGGTCTTFVVDHSDDVSVNNFFQSLEQHLKTWTTALSSPLRLVFVNNAYDAVQLLVSNSGLPYWQRQPADPATYWDSVNCVGLRQNFVCSIHASRIIANSPGATGFIVNVTSWGGIFPLFDVAYAVGKAGVDRMSAEFGRVAPDGVHFLSFCPGFVGTEAVLSAAREQRQEQQRQQTDSLKDFSYDDHINLPLWNMETPLFVGRVLAAVTSDQYFVEQVNGKVVIAAEAADYFGINDEHGFRALSSRSMRVNLIKNIPQLLQSPLRFVFPRTLLIPWWLIRAKAAIQYWN